MAASPYARCNATRGQSPRAERGPCRNPVHSDATVGFAGGGGGEVRVAAARSEGLVGRSLAAPPDRPDKANVGGSIPSVPTKQIIHLRTTWFAALSRFASSAALSSVVTRVERCPGRS